MRARRRSAGAEILRRAKALERFIGIPSGKGKPAANQRPTANPENYRAAVSVL
jgi:hypothetical protein